MFRYKKYTLRLDVHTKVNCVPQDKTESLLHNSIFLYHGLIIHPYLTPCFSCYNPRYSINDTVA